MPAAVTPSGVRDGDPAALAGLCAARGPSVWGYCRHVAGDDAAGEAAADAFASFRTAVIATDDLADLNPEALLINATRNAAARHAPHAPVDVCAVVPLLLAARAGKTIAAADRATLEQHLETCFTCRAPVARFEAAERAYRDPPDPLMDPAVVAAIIAAMAAAAPAGGAPPRPQAANGGARSNPDPQPEPGPEAVPGDVPVADTVTAAAATSVEQPTTESHAPDVLDPDPAAAQLAASATPEPARPAGRDGPSGKAKTARAAPVLIPPRRAGVGRGARRSRSGRPLPIILPVAVVLLALVVALFVSGVFGGDDPASSPRVDVPADVPAHGTPADVVVVPGAEQASPDDVESAKARERARERRKRAAAARRAAAEREREAATTTPSTTAAPPPAAAPPPPPPPPARPANDAGSRKVDAGSGATGAEQIPPAADTSTVPELAPAPESATAP